MADFCAFALKSIFGVVEKCPLIESEVYVFCVGWQVEKVVLLSLGQAESATDGVRCVVNEFVDGGEEVEEFLAKHSGERLGFLGICLKKFQILGRLGVVHFLTSS